MTPRNGADVGRFVTFLWRPRSSHTIAIIGAGNVGATLGRRFAEVEHRVIFGLREPENVKYASLDGNRGSRDSIASAAARAEVVLLATPWKAAQDALAAAGDLAGKMLIDATNPIGPVMVLRHGTNDSGVEPVRRWSRGVHSDGCAAQCSGEYHESRR